MSGVVRKSHHWLYRQIATPHAQPTFQFSHFYIHKSLFFSTLLPLALIFPLNNTSTQSTNCFSREHYIVGSICWHHNKGLFVNQEKFFFFFLFFWPDPLSNLEACSFRPKKGLSSVLFSFFFSLCCFGEEGVGWWLLLLSRSESRLKFCRKRGFCFVGCWNYGSLLGVLLC